MLRIEKLRKSFGAFLVTNDVSFEVRQGELCSIIGPNGAGKTTLFNLLSGYLNVDDGDVFFKGEKITGLKPFQIARKGLCRSFQRTNIFPGLTVFDNVQVSIMAKQRVSKNIFRSSGGLFKVETEKILENVGLEAHKDMLAGLLPYGDQRSLEIGIALGSNPEALLLDEPTAGMSPEETVVTMELVKRLSEEMNLAVLLIEHDINFVFSISNTIRVLHQGRIIAEGNPSEVKSNSAVQEVYLGAIT